ncbi:hypothetical protein PP175_29415 (plasmid) [Aneurinibacillus sp. Ricciae_BoGa-3]|uniref:hypothetical protein n=1 Tax=Aneurinibacillus sp. Ricciae_BoGa-3 TaxID=3022697 RepID=UPI00233F9F69|nr:hypothetical protein [Aneurinibacillus sp. Ricciae_BoGa-3]WCK57311.1 hypothetical protein PP175_29415 [Aneurinibacillus sp. Ricciae_BoGa-3]
MKFLFVSTQELNQLSTELYNRTCKINFSEELEDDVVETYDSTGSYVQKTTRFKEMLPLLNQHFNVLIKKYDVTELDDFGEGFIFFF